MTAEKALLTADDLLRLPDDGQRHELVRGELRTMAPAGFEHGFIAGRAFKLMSMHVDAHGLGCVLAAETGFRISRNPDTVRAPDVAFVAAERLPRGRLPTAYGEMAPDLVVEVVSPSDTAGEIQEKIYDWLGAGVRVALVLYPSTRSVAVYRSLRQVQVLTQDEQLDLDDVLPGFRCSVRDFFSLP
jgi:Uma2 family endonuclease